MTLVRWSDPFREFAQLQDRINGVYTDYGRSGDEGLMTTVPGCRRWIYQDGVRSSF